MTATNHALTGALIGLTISNPMLALPLAFMSHFVCDAIPHYGPAEDEVATKRFKNRLIFDASLCVLLVVVLATGQPVNWLLAAVCAFLATSPDLMWFKKFQRAQQGESHNPGNKPSWPLRYHAAIQWFEKPIGLTVELAWAVASLILLKVYLI